MFKQIACQLLNNILGDYCDNLQQDQLDLQVWSGDVALSNLQLRHDLLNIIFADFLAESDDGTESSKAQNITENETVIPEIISASIGEFRMQIPWSQLKSKPVKVLVKNVFILVSDQSPRWQSMESSNSRNKREKSIEEKKYQEYLQKLKRLEVVEKWDLEHLNTQIGKASTEDSAESNSGDRESNSFLSKLVTKIIDNLQVTIENVHIRYETFVRSGHNSKIDLPFIAAGVTIGHLSALSCQDDSFNPNDKVTSESLQNDGTVYKFLDLENFSVYFDTENGNSLAERSVSRSYDSWTKYYYANKEKTSLESKINNFFLEYIPGGSLHCNAHQYILRPVKSCCKLTIRKKLQNLDLPKIESVFEFDDLRFELDSTQISSVMALFNKISVIKTGMKYRSLRNECLSTNSDGKTHLNRWKFCSRAILNQIRRKKEQWSWEFFKRRITLRRHYVRLWKKKINETGGIFFDALPPEKLKGKYEQPPIVGFEPSENYLEDLKSLEMELSFNDIRIFRYVANLELWRERADEEDVFVDASETIEDDRPDTELSATKKDGGWFGWFFGSSKSANNTDEYRNDRFQLSSDDRRELFETIGFDDSFDSMEKSPNEKNEIILSVSFRMKNAIFKIFEDIKHRDISNKSLVCATTRDIKSRVKAWKSHYALDFSIGDVQLECDDGTESRLLVNSQMLNQTEKMFNLSYETHPDDLLDSYDATLEMRSSRLVLTVLPKPVLKINEFFQRHILRKEFYDMNNDIYNELRRGIDVGLDRMGKGALSFALENHQSVDMNINLYAPVLVFPIEAWFKDSDNRDLWENVFTAADKRSIIVDFGRFVLKSDVLKRSQKRQISESISEVSSAEIEKRMYDSFEIQLKKMSIALMKDFKSNEAVSLNSFDGFLLHPVDVSLRLDFCILNNVFNLPKVKADLNVSSIVFDISDSKVYITWNSLLFLLQELVPSKPISTSNVASTKSVNSNTELAISDNAWKPSLEKFSTQVLFCGLFSIEKFVIRISRDTYLDELLSSIGIAEVVDLIHPGKFAELSLENFKFQAKKRSFDTELDFFMEKIVLNHVNSLEDCKKSPILLAIQESNDASPGDWAHINLKTIDSQSHPEYKTLLNGYLQTLKASFGKIDLVLDQEIILRSYKFSSLLMKYISLPSTQVAQNSPDAGPETVLTKEVDQNEKKTNKSEFYLGKVNVLVKNTDNSIAEANISELNFSMSQEIDQTTNILVSIGDIALVDLVKRSDIQNHSSKIISTKPGELLSFAFKTFKAPDREWDSTLHVRGNSIQIFFSELFFLDLIHFFNNLKPENNLQIDEDALSDQYSALYSSTENSVQKLGVDLQIDAPVIIFPKSMIETSYLSLSLGSLDVRNKISIEKNQKKIEYSLILEQIGAETVIDGNPPCNLLQRSSIEVTVSKALESSIESSLIVSCDFGSWYLGFDENQLEFFLGVTYSVLHSPLFDMKDEDTSKKIQGNPSKPPSSAEPKISIRGNVRMHSFSALLKTAGSNDFADINISGLNIDMNISEDGRIEILGNVHGFNINDLSRTSAGIKNVFCSDCTNNHFLAFDVSLDSINQSTSILKINSPQIILIPSFVFFIKDFVTAAFQRSSFAYNDISNIQEIPRQKVDNGRTDKTKFRVEMNDLDVSILKDTENKDTDALNLKICKLVITKEHIYTFACSKMQLNLFSFQNKRDSIVKILEEFDFALHVGTKQVKGSNFGESSSIKLSAPSILVLKLSYQDAISIHKIVKLFIGETTDALSPAKSYGEDSLTVTSTLKKADSFVSQVENIKMKGIQEFNASISGARIIFIDDLRGPQMPMLDVLIRPITIDVFDWSADMKIRTDIGLKLSNFNVKNSHWEPLLEPSEFSIELKRSRSPEKTEYILSSSEKLDFTISHDFLVGLFYTLKRLQTTEAYTIRKRNNSEAPYVIKNQTGYKITISSDYSEECQSLSLEPEDACRYEFENWRTMRENFQPKIHQISIKVHGVSWEKIERVPVGKTGISYYPLRPNTSKIPHCLVCEIELVQNVKFVTLRSSLQILNETSVNLELVTVDTNGSLMTRIQKIRPNEKTAVPIEAAYSNGIKIRPDGNLGFQWPLRTLKWKNVISSGLRNIPMQCGSSIDDSGTFHYVVEPIIVKNSPLFGRYPVMSLNILAPLEIENLLPYNLKFTIIDQKQHCEFGENLNQGETKSMYSVNTAHLLALKIEVIGSAFKHSRVSIISSENSSEVERFITLFDEQGNPLRLLLNHSHGSSFGSAKRISIVAPYVILNKTGIPIIFKVKSLVGESQSAGQPALESSSTSTKPLMFSFPPKQPIKSKPFMKTRNSGWSNALNFDTVGAVSQIELEKSGNRRLLFGYKVENGQGKYRLSKIITFSPRYIFKNELSEQISLKILGVDKTFQVDGSSSLPIFDFAVNSMKLMSIKMTSGKRRWSPPFDFNSVQELDLRAFAENNEDLKLFKIEITVVDSTIFVIVRSLSTEWPFLLRNDSSIDVQVHQKHCNEVFSIESGSILKYSWDEPSRQDKCLVLKILGHSMDLDINAIGSSQSFHYLTKNQSNASVRIAITSYGASAVTTISDDFKERNVQNSGTISNADADSPKKASEIETSSMRLELNGIGISLITKARKELAYIYMQNFQIVLRDLTNYQSLSCNLKWLQIDNQDFDSSHPIILYPSVLDRSAKDGDTNPSVFQLAITKAKEKSGGLDHFNIFNVLLQELSLEIEEYFLLQLVEFFRFESIGVDDTEKSPWDSSVSLLEPAVKTKDPKMYFEIFQIQPLKFNLTFSRSEKVSSSEELERSSNPIMFLLNILTMTIGNVSDASIKFPILSVNNMTADLERLNTYIILHYKEKAVSQLYNFLGSADFLGNPVGLFNQLGSGVRDMFYEPYLGFVSDRPQDFGVGVARGTTSFLRKTLYGVSDTFSKVSSSVGKGLATATMDEHFQRTRNDMRKRNKPSHTINGLEFGASKLAHGFLSGFSGVIEQPIRGAEKEGIGGFFKGIGKGIVGSVTKPMVGVFDLANNFAEGVRSGTNSDESSLERIRSPRYIDSSGILSPYSQKSADGYFLMHSYLNDIDEIESYIHHVHLVKPDEYLLLSSKRIVELSVRKRRPEWQIMLSEIQNIKYFGEKKIQFVTSAHLDDQEVLFSTASDADSFGPKVIEAIENYKIEKKLTQ